LENQLTGATPPEADVDSRIARARRQAGLGVALLVMGKGEKVWPLFRHRPDPTARSYLIERLAPGGVDPKVLLARLDEEKDVSARRAILLSLGEYGPDRMTAAERWNHLPRLRALYRDDPDPGIHGAAEWILRQWGASDDVSAIDSELATGSVLGGRRWYRTPSGYTMVVIHPPEEFWMGEDPERHRHRIGRNFAVASKEVTADQFLKFRAEHQFYKPFPPTGDCPANGVTWWDAAAYCNFLSEQEGLPRDQWCYLPNEKGKYDKGMSLAPDGLKRTGYRLPMEEEWEYVCGAGAETAYSCGEAVDLVLKYGWFDANSSDRLHPVGMLKSNDLGLFDMHGNAMEWCQETKLPYSKAPDQKGIFGSAWERVARVIRGGGFNHWPPESRTAYRGGFGPEVRYYNIGFRLARTLPD
jgi:formylglycine-generating enzyme required for sulfatase activity